MAAGASLALFLTLFLPWYQETVVAAGKTTSASLTGWAAFSFVEAAVLLVAVAVLTLLVYRAEGRAFHLPGGDGGAITVAGVWTCVLVVWRILDKQGAHVSGPGAAASGVEWGIFVALAVAAGLTYAGSRIRAAGTPEPPLPEDEIDFSPLPRRSRRAEPAVRDRRPGRRPTAPASAEPAPVRPRRPRAQPSAAGFPVPEPLEDPPTLRLGRRAAPRPASEPATEEQLTIPFEDGERQ